MKKNNMKSKLKNFLTPLTITLIVAVLAGIITLAIVLNKHTQESPSSPTAIAPVDENNPSGNNVLHAEKYLEEKYGLDFIYADSGGGVSLFDAEGLLGTVAIMRREVIHELIPNQKDLFTDIYGDNAYLIINQQKASEYYQQFINVDLGTHKILTYIDINVNPSSVKADTPFVEYLNIVKGIAVPELIILTDKELSKTELNSIEDALKKTKQPTTVRVCTLPPDIQKIATPNSILRLGSDWEDVQYYKKINQ